MVQKKSNNLTNLGNPQVKTFSKGWIYKTSLMLSNDI